MSTPLTKRAGFADLAKDALWDSNAGPLENIFRLIENGAIVFSGGAMSLVLIGLKIIGYSLSDLGRYLDQGGGFSDIGDLAGADPEEVASHAEGLFGPPLASTGATHSNYFVVQADVDEDLKKEQLRSAQERRKNQQEDRHYQAKMRKYRERELGRNRDWFGRTKNIGYARSGLLLGLTGLLGWLFKSLTDPKSNVARVLRGAGAYGAERINEAFVDGKDAPASARQKTAPAAPAAPENPKINLERAVDQILES